MAEKLELTDAEWRARLSPEAYRVLRRRGTEPVGSGCLLGTKESGLYRCAGCDQPLFVSHAKFDSGTGWPAFTAPVAEDALAIRDLSSHGMFRAEVSCAGCDGHLGHVFSDGPPPAPRRFCINSVALRFEPR